MAFHIAVAVVILCAARGLWVALRDDDQDRLTSLPDPSPERDLLTRTKQ